jgi:hypothetical protein
VEADAPVAGPSAGSSQQKGKTSATNSAPTQRVLRVRSGKEMTKMGEFLPEAEEDLQMQKGQCKAQPVLQTRTSRCPSCAFGRL